MENCVYIFFILTVQTDILEATNHTNLCYKASTPWSCKNGCCTGTEYTELPKMSSASFGKVGRICMGVSLLVLRLRIPTPSTHGVAGRLRMFSRAGGFFWSPTYIHAQGLSWRSFPTEQEAHEETLKDVSCNCQIHGGRRAEKQHLTKSKL